MKVRIVNKNREVIQTEGVKSISFSVCNMDSEFRFSQNYKPSFDYIDVEEARQISVEADTSFLVELEYTPHRALIFKEVISLRYDVYASRIILDYSDPFDDDLVMLDLDDVIFWNVRTEK